MDYKIPPPNALAGITVSGTPSSGQTLVATSSTAASWATPSASAPRLLPLLDIPTIVAQAPTLLEEHPARPGVLRAKGRGFGTVANVLSSGLTTWTGVNTSKLTSAAASADSVTLTHNGTDTDQTYGGADTAPRYERSIPRGPLRSGVVFHMAASLPANGGSARAGIFDSNDRCLSMVDFNNSAGTLQFRYLINDTSFAVIGTRTAGELTTGTWIWIEVDEIAEETCISYVHASFASGEPTTGWTIGKIYTINPANDATRTWVETFGVIRNAADTAGSATYSGWRRYQHAATDMPIAVSPPLGGTGYPTTGTPVYFASLDYGSGKGIPDLTQLRLDLAGMVNRLGETGSVLFGCTGSDTSLAACTVPATMEAAAAMDLRDPDDTINTATTKRYWRHWVRFDSSDNLKGCSIHLGGRAGVYAAP